MCPLFRMAILNLWFYEPSECAFDRPPGSIPFLISDFNYRGGLFGVESVDVDPDAVFEEFVDGFVREFISVLSIWLNEIFTRLGLSILPNTSLSTLVHAFVRL